MALKFPKMFFRKVIIGIALIIVAALLSLFIKESLDTSNPASALPEMSVTYNGNTIDPAYVFMAEYEWNFLTTIERSPKLLIEDIPLRTYDVLPQLPMEISFSKAPKSIKVSRASGRYSADFTEIITSNSGEFFTPNLPGVYVYKIEASWAMRGSILYYIALQTKAA